MTYFLLQAFVRLYPGFFCRLVLPAQPDRQYLFAFNWIYCVLRATVLLPSVFLSVPGKRACQRYGRCIHLLYWSCTLLCVFSDVSTNSSKPFFKVLLIAKSFHIMWNHSHSLTSFCNKLDYLGILILMWGASIPTIYYGFFCNQSLQWLYWMTVS
jgi:predicted membrane channel-forming protein YqfA (hemolysin III family)